MILLKAVKLKKCCARYLLLSNNFNNSHSEVLKSFMEIIDNIAFTHFEIKALIFNDNNDEKWKIKFLTVALLKDNEKQFHQKEIKGKTIQLIHRISKISNFNDFLSQSLKRKIKFDRIDCFFAPSYPSYNKPLILDFSPEGAFGIKGAHHRLIMTGLNTDVGLPINELIIINRNQYSAPQILTNFFGFTFGPEGFNFGFDDFIIFLAPV